MDEVMPAAGLDRIAPDVAESIATRALTDAGVPPADSAAVADALVHTSLRGISTHGLRLLPQYLDDIAHGIANPRPLRTVVRETGPTAVVDADAALGIVAGLGGTREAVRRAARFGVSVVVVRNSNHFGAASVYSRAMAREGMVGWVMTSCSPRVAPFNGSRAHLGTNPISVAAGGGDHEFVLDMATSQVCLGEIRERGRQGVPLEEGWAKDAAGRPTVDAAQVSTLTPLGAGHKGQALGMVVTLMTAVLADSPLDWELEHIESAPHGRGREVAHFLMCLDPAVFGGREAFDARMRTFVDDTRSSPASGADPVRVPGDPERIRAARNAAHGIPLDPRTGRELRRLAAGYGMDDLLTTTGIG
ncbi:putative malate dehydrogenase [Actinacidiphila reveromycinica]|uniref:Putative malate dehydrogenase n=1 Tax=Actinacidiphila reveromycinica TaxID=659352 RepID=A0A7U3V097_9ACTN|nr:Ldh family oxidoreductase [Streptomyces sp. SN-593]BBB01897.1 putative malate dehydrogenase [Streptomyces sp. SN-593]